MFYFLWFIIIKKISQQVRWYVFIFAWRLALACCIVQKWTTCLWWNTYWWAMDHDYFILFPRVRNVNSGINHLKVVFFIESTMHLSCPQKYEPFIFLNLKIWIFVIFKTALANQPSPAFLPLQASKLSNFMTSSISRQILVTKIQIFKFRKMKG